MYKTRYQAEYNDYVQRYGRDWKLSVSPFNSKMIMNFKYEGILGDSKTFTLGANATNIIDIEVYFPDGNENSFKGTTLEPILELRTEVLIENVLTEVWQEVPLGKFIVSEVSRQNTSTISLTAVDKMSHDNYGNKIYECNLSFPTNTISLLRDVAGRMSCSIENENDVPNFPIKEKKKINGKPLRKVLSYIACLYGGFVKINRKGNIEFFKTYDTGIKYDTNGGIKKITEGEPIMSISGIKCQISPKEFIQAGTISETETIEIINYDMTKENLISIFDYYKGKKYYSVIYDGMINPALDPGDIITVSNMQGVDKKIMKNISSYLNIYIITLVLSVFLIALDNFDPTTSFTAVISCLNNIGPGLEVVGPVGNYSEFSVLSKLVLIFDMLAGRLELFPILLLFSPNTWKKAK